MARKKSGLPSVQSTAGMRRLPSPAIPSHLKPKKAEKPEGMDLVQMSLTGRKGGRSDVNPKGKSGKGWHREL